MKRLLPAALFLMAAAPAVAADVDFGVSMTVGEPGFYGTIDIGNYPRPQVINVEPVIVQPVVGVRPAPVYMHVPPGHAKKWARYCRNYNACSRPVVFVTEDWYEGTYVPKYREKHGKSGRSGKGHGGDGGKHHGNGKGHGKGRD